jgi:hypothetical protein
MPKFLPQVGDGPQRELLEHLVILNGLQNVFFFRGHRENVHAELQVFLFLSFRISELIETFRVSIFLRTLPVVKASAGSF